MCLHCLIRQEVSALRADFVRRQAEEEAYYTQQVEIIFQRSSICETQSLHSSLLYCFDLNAGSSAKGRGAAQKHPGTRGRKTNATEEKVKSTTPAHIHNYVVSEKKKNDGIYQNWLSTLLCPLQVGSHEEGAEGEGVTAARCNQKTFPQTPAGPENLADKKTRPGNW